MGAPARITAPIRVRLDPSRARFESGSIRARPDPSQPGSEAGSIRLGSGRRGRSPRGLTAPIRVRPASIRSESGPLRSVPSPAGFDPIRARPGPRRAAVSDRPLGRVCESGAPAGCSIRVRLIRVRLTRIRVCESVRSGRLAGAGAGRGRLTGTTWPSGTAFGPSQARSESGPRLGRQLAGAWAGRGPPDGLNFALLHGVPRLSQPRSDSGCG